MERWTGNNQANGDCLHKINLKFVKDFLWRLWILSYCKKLLDILKTVCTINSWYLSNNNFVLALNGFFEKGSWKVATKSLGPYYFVYIYICCFSSVYWWARVLMLINPWHPSLSTRAIERPDIRVRSVRRYANAANQRITKTVY